MIDINSTSITYTKYTLQPTEYVTIDVGFGDYIVPAIIVLLLCLYRLINDNTKGH